MPPTHPPARPVRRPSLVSGGRALGIAEITGFLAPLAVLPHMTRALGLASYGRLQFIGTLGAFASLVADPGLGRVALRRTARSPQQVLRLAGRLQPLRFATACLAGLLLCGSALLLHVSEEHRTLALLQSGIIVVQALSVDPYLSGLGFIGWIGLARAASLVAYAIGVLVLVKGQDDAPVALACTLAVSVAAVAVGRWRLRSLRGRSRWSVALRPSIVMLRESVGYGLSSVMSSIYARIDVLMLRWLRGESAVGVYSAAVRISEAVFALVNVVVSTLFPRAVTFARTSRARAAVCARRALRLGMLMAVPTAVGASVAGGPILLWVAGPQFRDEGALMAILGWVAVPATAAIMVSTFGLGAYGRSGALLFATTVGAVVNASLNLVAIPWLGPEGAACTTVLAQLAVAVAGLRRSQGAVALSPRRTLCPWVVPSLGMGATVLAVRAAGGGAALLLLVGILAYTGLVTLLGALRRSERVSLGRLLFLGGR